MLALAISLMIALSPPQSDYNTICKVVAAEARGESLRGQMAVAEVIINRSELWGKDIKGIVSARGQFAPPYKGEISTQTREAVFRSLILRERVFKHPVTHFLSNKAYWEQSKRLAGRIGVHKFYY